MSSTTGPSGQSVDPYKQANKEDDITLQQKIEDLTQFMDACKFGMMTTHDAETGKIVSRCMAIAGKESGGIDLLFHTNTHSGKTHDLATDAHINISFLNSGGEWASISGTATVVTDRELVKKHYSPSLKAWMGDLGDGKHDGGPEDPRIGVIRVKMQTAIYAVNKKALPARMAEVAKGTVTGQPASVNKLREIGEDEVAKWRQSQSLVN